MRIQLGAPDSDTQFPGNYRDYSTAHTALSRQPHQVGKIPRLVIKPTGKHDCIDSLGFTDAENALTGCGYDTVIGKKQKRPRQSHTTHADGALMAVGIENSRVLVLYVVMGLHEINQGTIGE